MKTGFRNLFIILFIIAMAIVLVWQYTFRKTENDVSGKKPDYTLSVNELVSEFEKNEATANEKYLNKIVQVTGTVESVSEDSVGISLYMKEPDSMAGIICGFDAEGNDISGVRKGAIATVKGICTGYLMDVVLNKCSLEQGGD